MNIILDGKKVTAEKGEYILAVAKRNGIEIPTLCHDPRLEPFSSCYVCVVEVEGMRGLQPSCSTRVSEGMVIHTGNEKVKESRKAALDLILSDHYADCVAPCKDTCPAGVDVQGYIALIDKKMYSEAVRLIKETNPLPAICGRVCVRPCEAACRRNLMDENTGVGIDYLKRFASDYDLNSEKRYIPEVAPTTNKKIAIIGAGPGGLSAAYFLQQKGHQCDIFEAAPHAGGWLRYGIPEYRLPNNIIDKEVESVTELGANIFFNKTFGKDVSYKEIQEKYDSTILTIGSQRGALIGCTGEEADGVFSGIDFLRNMEVTGQKYDFTGKTIVVVGGGNTAMDCCRTAIRCGSTDVKVIYRRTEKEMPANPIEIHESKIEGVEYLFLNNPTNVNADADGKVKSMNVIKMALGEPDASGRRRPVPVEGSEYELKCDYILAAIGQKTDINFLADVNANTKDGELKANKWGDIDANRHTLQTGIPSMFAAGDGVTGPATLIEAIAQAQIASRSCHQYLMGEELIPKEKEFLSKKDNFKTQESVEYVSRYQKQLREEMPVLDSSDRVNYKEVELGYKDEDIATHETARCLECGCTEYFTCDLKAHATKYGAEQTKYNYSHHEHEIRFDHPYIEIDSNKCVLCSRCVRICSEVVGANALGLVERGSETYVAPSMGGSLAETTCESCGLCISTCPTGAITENFTFKPGPFKLTAVKTICNYCSVGCEIEINHKGNYVMKVTGSQGLINTDGNLCKYPKFGYNYINDASRIKKPLLKVNGKFEEISYDKAYDIIKEKIKAVDPNQNAFFAGARLSNEEQYLVQKLARVGAKTNNVSSFHYLHGSYGYSVNTVANTPFEQIKGASKVVYFGTEINKDNAVVGFMVNNAKVPTILITEKKNNSMEHKVDETIIIDSYFYFVKAVNYYLLDKGLENAMFIKDNCTGFEEFKTQVLAEDYKELCQKACGGNSDIIEKFAKEYNNEMNAILIFSEKEIMQHPCMEVFNLAMITGKLGKTSNGLISLKEKNNSQGLFDMGARGKTGVGRQAIDNKDFVEKLKKVWGVDSIPTKPEKCLGRLFENKTFKNLFIFGEDPIGCSNYREETEQTIKASDFVLVQDVFMTETAKEANLILPASMSIETSGSFTNTQKVIQEFEAGLPMKIEKSNVEQLVEALFKFGTNSATTVEDVKAEALSLLPTKTVKQKHNFEYIESCSCRRMYEHGCDNIVKRFDDEFLSAFE